MVNERIVLLHKTMRLTIFAVLVACIAGPLFGARPVYVGDHPVQLFFFGMMACIAWLTSLRRFSDIRSHMLSLAVFEFFALCVVMRLATYQAASFNLPLQDAALVSFDRMIGFDWNAYIAAMKESAAVAAVLEFAYKSNFIQIWMLFIILVRLEKYDEIRLLIAMFVIGLVITTVISAFVPALPAYAYFGLLGPETPEGAVPGASYVAYVEMMKMRTGEVQAIDILTGGGIVAFPSFHTMMAIFFTAAAWSIWWARYPVLLLNLGMIAATPVHGGHYLADVIAGGLIAVAIVYGLRRWAFGSAASTAQAPAAMPA